MLVFTDSPRIDTGIGLDESCVEPCQQGLPVALQEFLMFNDQRTAKVNGWTFAGRQVIVATFAALTRDHGMPAVFCIPNCWQKN